MGSRSKENSKMEPARGSAQVLGGRLKYSVRPAIVLLTLEIGLLGALAWPRKHYSKTEILSRAELVVVAKVQDASLTLVPHDRHAGAGASWEHHVRLLISEVIKGTNAAKVITASIGYGLDPIVGGYYSNEFRTVIITNIATYRTGYPKDIVQVFDTGTSAGSCAPISGDIRTNHIWLLRRVTEGGDHGLLGIHDPEDLQPIARRSELLEILKRGK